MSENKKWKKGRGKLGMFEPLLGRWRAETDSELGMVLCVREFSKVLDGAYVQLAADWVIGKKSYSEIALFGVNDEKKVGFWSFTSDKKQSKGVLADATDVHTDAIGFEAQMPAGLARMIYWPHEEAGFTWAVESKTKKGWNRFTEHHYLPD